MYSGANHIIHTQQINRKDHTSYIFHFMNWIMIYIEKMYCMCNLYNYIYTHYWACIYVAFLSFFQLAWDAHQYSLGCRVIVLDLGYGAARCPEHLPRPGAGAGGYCSRVSLLMMVMMMMMMNSVTPADVAWGAPMWRHSRMPAGRGNPGWAFRRISCLSPCGTRWRRTVGQAPLCCAWGPTPGCSRCLWWSRRKRTRMSATPASIHRRLLLLQTQV